MKLNLKSVLTGSAATIALVAASSANASGYYVGLFGGISTIEDDFTVATSTSSSTSRSVSTSTTSSTGLLGANTAWSKTVFDYTPNNTTTGTFTGATGYLGLNYGYNQNSVTFAARTTVFSAGHSFDDGFVLGGSIGWDFGNGWRNELEVAYRQNDVDASAIGWSSTRGYTAYSDLGYSGTYLLLPGQTFLTYVGLNTLTTTGFYALTGTSWASGKSTFGTSSSGIAGGSINGELETWSFMYNVWYDFDFGDSPIHPFIGGGIGFAHASLEYSAAGISATGIASTTGFFGTSFTGGSYRGNGEATDWGFAYQVGAGLGYDLGNGMMLSAQYRYFNTGAMDLSLADQIEVNLESHNFLVGLNIPLGGGM